MANFCHLANYSVAELNWYLQFCNAKSVGRKSNLIYLFKIVPGKRCKSRNLRFVRLVSQ